ncbi:MAG: cytochrome b/b6 domain-containing protein [Gammaproteobacteria bacterium]|jgi:cytochrome b
MPEKDTTVRVWDPLVRLFHWSLVAAFLIAWLTEDDWLGLHVTAGYTVLGLVLFRLVWGVIGTRHARFTDFVRSPAATLVYLKDALLFRARRYLGHNPAGGAMVIALLVSLTLTGVSGLAVYGHAEFSGPLAGLLHNAPGWLGEVLEEVHEFFAGFTLLLVVLHVAGVALASLQHGENLVRSMLTGRKQQEPSR